MVQNPEVLKDQHTRKSRRFCTYVFPTCVTVLCVQRLKAVAAVWSSVLHDVALPPQGGLTLITTEVPHVPVSAFSLGALVSKDDLWERENRPVSRQTTGEGAGGGWRG